MQNSVVCIQPNSGGERRLSLKARMRIAFAALALLITSNAGIALGMQYGAMPVVAGSIGLLATALLCVLLNRDVPAPQAAGR